MKPTYEDTQDFKNAELLLQIPEQHMINQISTRGTAVDEKLNVLTDLNRIMRNNYKDIIYKTGRNLYPLIIARDHLTERYGDDIGRQGLGGTYTLYLEDGRSYTVRPTPPEYEFLKCLGHIPLGLATVVAPYFNNPEAVTWKSKLSEYRNALKDALVTFQISDSGFEQYHELAMDSLSIAEEYVDLVFSKNSITPQDYKAFTLKLRPYVITAMDSAARCQINAVVSAMNEWKDMIGPDLWSQVIVAIPVIWPVTENSPRLQVFKYLMEPDHFKTNVFCLEGASTADEIRTLLGRIFGDRLIGRFAFHPEEDDKGSRMFQCLSSHTDVVSDSAHEALVEMSQRGTTQCPVNHPTSL